MKCHNAWCECEAAYDNGPCFRCEKLEEDAREWAADIREHRLDQYNPLTFEDIYGRAEE